MSLLQGITEANGYRRGFVRYMEANLVEPRSNPWDHIYEWARGNEMTRQGMPGCRCMQARMYSYDAPGRWVDLLLDNRSGRAISTNARLMLFTEKKGSSTRFSQQKILAVEKEIGATLSKCRANARMPNGDEAPFPARGSSKSRQKTAPAPKPSHKGTPREQRHEQIIQAIRDLPKNARRTKDGSPYVSELEKILGFDITSDERNQAWNAYQTSPKPKPTPPKSHRGKWRESAKSPSEADLHSLIKEHQVKVTKDEANDALLKSEVGKLDPILIDRTYTALPMAVWLQVLEWSDVDRIEYVSEVRDCDNFAIALTGQIGLRLKVNGCGIVFDWSGKHAYNVLLVKDTAQGGIYAVVVEPQSDRIAQVGESKGPTEMYKADRGMIIFG